MSEELMRRAAAEAREDLDKFLMPTARAMTRQHQDADLSATELARGLLRQTTWDRPMLASVLGAALVRLAERDLADRTSPVPVRPTGEVRSA